MRPSGLENMIAKIISPAIADLELELLWVEYKGGILSVFAENPETGKITLEECTKISREISPLLEVEDPISSAYRLEVSSAGIDRPLLKQGDYETYKDLEAKFELDELIDGQKKFRGFIRTLEDNIVTIETDQGMMDFPYDTIYKAKLVMNDHLIKETKKRFDVSNQNENKTKDTKNQEEN